MTSDQTHTANVRVITEEDRGNGITKPRPYTDVDGMVTNVPGLVLATFYADCVPLYFVDPVHRAIGLSHSGWRGTAAKIGKVTVEKMNEEYGTDPKDIYSAIGPSICRKHGLKPRSDEAGPMCPRRWSSPLNLPSPAA